MPTRASHVGGLATATTERASLMDEPAERAGRCDSAARHGFHPDGAQVGVKGAEGAALAKALFMTVRRPSPRSAEKSCGIRQG